MGSQPPSNLVSVTIDGRVARVPKGMSLVDAAATVGIEIPVFCYHPKLKPVGACRMCFVQIAPAPRLTTACTTAVTDGMVVTTTTELVRHGRQQVLEFLLINHPLDCPVCDKGGECPLQDNTFGHGLGNSRFIEPKRRYEKPVDLSPLIKLDRERCILCYRCTRFAQEIAGDESLTVLERGNHSEIGLAEGRTFDSPFSGNTTEICPVGALTSTLYRFRARPWDLNSIATVCPHCSVGCNITVHTRKAVDQVVRFMSRENAAVDDGWLCDYGRYNYDFINAANRLTQPLVRRDGVLQPASWDEALNAAANQLRGVAERHGASAVGGIAATNLTNEELYLFQKVMRLGLGTPNVDHRVDGAGFVAPFEYDAGAASIAALETAGAILVVGADPINETPVLDLRLKKAANRVPLLVIHDQPSSLTRRARVWLRNKPGTDLLVLAGLLKIILGEGLAVEGFEPAPLLREMLDEITVDQVAQASGVPAGDLDRAARLYAAAGPRRGAILYRRDDTARPEGTELLSALRALALMTGSSDEAGLGLHGLVQGANEQGAIDMGLLPTHLPGQASVESLAAREVVERQWQSALPIGLGLGGADMLSAATDGRLRGLYLFGGVPRGVAADPVAFATALAKLDVLIVQDITLTPLLRDHATVVLPGAAFTEKEGTFTNLERRVQRLRLGTAPPGAARSDWRIIRDLGALLAGVDAFDHPTPRDTMAEIVQVAPLYQGITYGRLGLTGLQWPTGLAPAGAARLVLAASAAPQG
ncbi:MAG: NADH-quinone oxidoreductase subunit NuoG [Chloroflexi bacterium]|nr:NADH-quinone oxidoreductase subunit NuoG [Chloroflexota bacterium]